MRVFRKITEENAEKLWRHLVRKGKYGDEKREYALPGLGRDKVWYWVEVPLDWLAFDWQSDDSRGTKLPRARSYAERPGEFPPGIALFDGSLPRAHVADGNHRGLAATLRGDKILQMLMPACDAEALWRAKKGVGC